MNRENNVPMTVRGVTKPIAQWVRDTGLPYELVYWRKVRGGWSDEDCLKPSSKLEPLIFNGERYSPSHIAKKLGISKVSVYSRIKAGWTVEEIINRPNSQPYKKPGWKFSPQPTQTV